MLRASIALLLLLGVSVAFGQLTLWNIQAHDNNRSPETVPGYYDDWLIFDRVNWDPVNAPWMENDLSLIQRNISALTIKNTGTTAITISQFNMSEPTWFTVLPEFNNALPKTLAAGTEWEIKVQFIFAGGPPTSKVAKMSIISDDPTRPVIDVGLGGSYSPIPEGPSEVPLSDVVKACGWTTIIDEFPPQPFLDWPHLSENITDGPRGDEFRAQFWGPADPTKPVFVRQAAAYQHCCTGAPEFVLLSQATGATLLKVNKQNPLNGQSVLPSQNGDPTKFNEGSATITEPFVVAIDGYRSDAPRWLGVHFYALRGRDGVVIPNTYIIPMDYVTPYYKGCLDPYNYPGYANCDFQDNVFYMTNVQPVGTVQTAAPPPTTSLTVTSATTAAATTGAAETTMPPTTTGGAVTDTPTNAPETTEPTNAPATPAPTQPQTTQGSPAPSPVTVTTGATTGATTGSRGSTTSPNFGLASGVAPLATASLAALVALAAVLALVL